MLKYFIILAFINKSVFTKTNAECGYKQCPPTKDGALNVHVIPHSHMDAGWVKTFDEYYYGTKTSVSSANVQLIYHSVLSELIHDKRRKFTFSETAYFWRWWKEQRGTTRATFRSLVAEGRIEFAGGGWVQADEATIDYLQLLDQYTWGLRKLNDTLGPCGKPKAAWQIDTYGHTREHASLVAEMGFDGLFIGRVEHKERETMLEEDRMEFIWRGSDVLGKMSDIITHALFNLYNAPDGFCFDFLCSDEPIVEDPDSKVYNADKRVNDFISQVERQAKYYDHDNIIVTMGGDFTYQSAANWFINIDKLINHVSTHPANMSDVNIFYSTPSCYLKSVYLYGRRDKALHTEKADHLPYASDANTYWTGFYTSRPSFKYLIKRAHVFLQVVKQLTVLSRMGDSYELHLLRHAVGLALHHDAITGTSQQHVTNDFIRLLSEAIEACSKRVSNYLSILTPTWGGSRRPKNSQQFIICHQLNMSQCRFTETQESILLIVYNPLSVKAYFHVRLPAIALHYSIRDYNDEEVEYQLVPLPTAIINMPGRTSNSIQEVCFEAENIPPLGYTAYLIAPIRDQLAEGQFVKKSQNQETEQELTSFISNEYIKVNVNKTSGLLESIQHIEGIKILISQNWYYYSQSQQTLQSGAYSFRPGKDRPTPVTDKVSYHTIRGTLVKEIRQRFSDWITQIIRLYRGEEFVEVEWIIGPVPIGTDLGKEVVTIFNTNISNNGFFYTDSNGRQMMKRTCWNESTSHLQKKAVPACQYPVTSRICLQSVNSSAGLCILTDRTQAATSYNEGELELMVHRRLLTDDGFGLEETLNEEAFGVGLVVKGKHKIFFGNHKQEVEGLSFAERATQLARKWTLEPWLFMTSGEKISRRKWQNVRNKRFSALRIHGLPRHIHILTLEPWKAGSVLLRLENTLEKGHGPNNLDNEQIDHDGHITVNIHKLLLHPIKAIQETTLAANQWLQDARQMDWSTRYVYNGGDDGILPEDNPDYAEDYKFSKQTEVKDSEHYSEEDYFRKKTSNQNNIKQNQSKVKRGFANRRRRAINSTENIIDNIQDLNLTTYAKIVKESNNTILSFDSRTIRPNVLKHYKALSRSKLFTTGLPKLSFLTSKIPRKFIYGDSKEIDNVSSEDDLLLSDRRFFKKRNRNRNKAYKQDDVSNIEEYGDGVTKSMYDMYYRTKNRIHTQKLYERSSELSMKRNNRRIKKDHSYKFIAKSNKKRLAGGMPYFIVNRRYNSGEEAEDRNTEHCGSHKVRNGVGYRRLDYNADLYPRRGVRRGERNRNKRQESDYEEDSQEEQSTNTGDDEDDYNRRRKRAIEYQPEQSAEQTEQAEQDYIITLRPTQIRTFIVMFERKKDYTL
ncbi:lysosomal alpha-mannosidase-like [Vanessa tameamea]|uniref:Lysosomal alpha-mannosidase-like n=1 Tax=Vanessa tameamea TaxID=334116 RepID=A0ABM4AXH4_VANTA